MEEVAEVEVEDKEEPQLDPSTTPKSKKTQAQKETAENDFERASPEAVTSTRLLEIPSFIKKAGKCDDKRGCSNIIPR